VLGLGALDLDLTMVSTRRQTARNSRAYFYKMSNCSDIGRSDAPLGIEGIDADKLVLFRCAFGILLEQVGDRFVVVYVVGHGGSASAKLRFALRELWSRRER
jgi:hypothetical protein